MEGAEALRATWAEHQAAAAREQELRLAMWRGELAEELGRQAALLAEGLLAQQRRSEAGLEDRLEALDARVRESLEAARGEAARASQELQMQQGAFEAILRSDVDRLGTEVRELRAATSSLGDGLSARQGSSDKHMEGLRLEAAEATRSLEGKLLGELRSLCDQAESRCQAHAEQAWEGLEARLLAAERRAAESRIEWQREADVGGQVAADQAEDLRARVEELGARAAATEWRLTELFEQRTEDLRCCLQQDLSALQRRLHSQMLQVVAAAFRSHAAHAAARDLEHITHARSL